MEQSDGIILLSICFPTYNRGEILDKTIQTYLDDPAFDEKVEIVISDNCSTDSTEFLVSKYLKQYKNVIYKKLDKNIGADLNVNSALSMGRGLYLKTMNDTATMKPGVLNSILNILNHHKNEKHPILFYQNIHFLNSDKCVYCSSLNELISNVSFYIGWLANFGIWRQDFESLEDKNKLASLQFVQADLTMRVIIKNSRNYLYFGDFYSICDPNTKGGYNVFHTFGIKYLKIYEEYIKSNQLSKKVLTIEKYRLFRYFLMVWYQILVLSKNTKFVFEKNDALMTMFKKYWLNYYFYFGIMYLYLKYLFLYILRKFNVQN
jgi:abequosyltransferase